jgi:prepilin-type N-terminal cleavage/methylation domain-containing protein
MHDADRRIEHPVSSNQQPVSRFTFHVSRLTSPAFTLIELLIVISIIALLAALTFPAVKGAKISIMRARARAEMIQLETAIERYKDKLGFYPPDNPANWWAMNQLFYELMGTTNIGTATAPVYATLDGSSRIKASDFGGAYGMTPSGPKVTGFMNCARPTRGDEAPSAMSFLASLKPGQSMMLTNPSGQQVCSILVCALDGPPVLTSAGASKINPWRYNSTNPRYNTKSYDLWIDVLAGSKTNRICNWSEKPIIISSTAYPN